MGQFGNEVMDFGGASIVRKRSGYTCFAIPDKPIDHPDWEVRLGNQQRSPRVRALEREERRALERHAREAGCRLLINPEVDLGRGEDANIARPRALLEFLESMPDDRIEVVVSPTSHLENLTIVGDWFYAESLTPAPTGFRQTVFTWHAPTVRRRARAFDEEFTFHLRAAGGNGSRLHAIDTIKAILARR